MSAKTGLKEQRRADESEESYRASERAICPNCNMLLSLRETTTGKCGNCGKVIDEAPA